MKWIRGVLSLVNMTDEEMAQQLAPSTTSPLDDHGEFTITGFGSNASPALTPGTPGLVTLPAKVNLQTQNGINLYYKAKSLIGKEFVAEDATDGYGTLACAEAVNYIAKKAIGKAIGGGNSTAEMLKALLDVSRFRQVKDPLPGDICMCATGTSSISPNLHGHVGITGYTWYMSMDSETHLLEANYTREMWEKSFAHRGFITIYFRVL